MTIAIRRGASLRALTAALATLVLAPAVSSAATALPVTGVETAVAPDPGLVQAITGLGASVGLTGAATADAQGRFVFPVTGGALTGDLVGKVNHTGGIQFKNRIGVKFGIQGFVIDTTGKAPQLTAVPTVGGFPLGLRVPVATITDLAVSSAPPATVVAGTLKLTDVGALYINLFLGKPAVKRGTVFGTAQATVTLGAA